MGCCVMFHSIDTLCNIQSGQLFLSFQALNTLSWKHQQSCLPGFLKINIQDIVYGHSLYCTIGSQNFSYLVVPKSVSLSLSLSLPPSPVILCLTSLRDLFFGLRVWVSSCDGWPVSLFRISRSSHVVAGDKISAFWWLSHSPWLFQFWLFLTSLLRHP